MSLEVHDDGFVLKCRSCGEELTNLGRTALLFEAAGAGWGLIVEPNGTYDYACSACLVTIGCPKFHCSQHYETMPGVKRAWGCV